MTALPETYNYNGEPIASAGLRAAKATWTCNRWPNSTGGRQPENLPNRRMARLGRAPESEQRGREASSETAQYRHRHG